MFQVRNRITGNSPDAEDIEAQTSNEDASAYKVLGAVSPQDAESDELKGRHGVLMDLLRDERDLQAEERLQMAIDHDFFDGLQWTPEDAQILLDRGQAPLVYNLIAPTVRWITGTQKRTRYDARVQPREPNDSELAEVKTKVIKWVHDVNDVQEHRSKTFEEAVIAGLSFLEDRVDNDPEREIIYSGRVSWRDCYRDSKSRRNDTEDWRYFFVQRPVDLDIAIQLFPAMRSVLDSQSTDTTTEQTVDDLWWMGERLTSATDMAVDGQRGVERSAFVRTATGSTARRKSLRIIEAWYRVPERVPFFTHGAFRNRPFDAGNPEHVQARDAGDGVELHVKMRWRVMLCTEETPLWDGPSPYKHNKLPYTPMWCFRRARDGAPYGVVRGMRDAQEDYNKRRSKALDLLSSNRVIADKDAVDDPEILRDEANRGDGVVLKKRGSDVRFEKPTGDFSQNLELMHLDQASMQEASGVTSELMGRTTNATSGKAILARQEQGGMVTADIFESARYAVQHQGRLQLSLIEQYLTEQKIVRIVGTGKPIEWLKVNEVDPVTGRVVNDLTASQADYIIAEQDWKSTLQQAAVESLQDLMSKLAPIDPGLVKALLPMLVEMMELPNKAAILDMVRKATGQKDPNREPTPEELAAEEQATKEAEARKELEMRMAGAKVDAEEAKAANAKAAAALAEANAILQRVESMKAALEAANVVATVPGVAPVADEIMAGAGYQDHGGQDPQIVQPEAVTPAAPIQPMPAPGAQEIPQ
jgi:hypothetical protein